MNSLLAELLSLITVSDPNLCFQQSVDVTQGLKLRRGTREVWVISERMPQPHPPIYGMTTPNGTPDELILTAERPLFAWIPLSDERISGKNIISSTATILLLRFWLAL